MPFDIAGALGSGYSASDITSYLAANPDPSLKFDVKGALGAGYSPEEVVDHLNGTSGGVLQGAPVIAPIMRGTAHAMRGVANLATDVGLPGVGSAIRGRINQEDLDAQTSGQNLKDAIKEGRYGAALGALPSAVLEQAPTLAAGAVAGAATGGAALPALGAAAATGALTNGDAVARARAANDGRSAPDAADLAVGLTGGAAQGAATMVPGVVPGRVLGTLAGAASDAASPEVNSLLSSAGTKAGAQNASLSDVVASAATGAATRGARSAASGAANVASGVAGLMPAARQAALADRYASMTGDEQTNVQNVAAAHKMLSDELDGASPNPADPRTTAAARTVGDRLSGQIQDFISSRQEAGVLDDKGADVLTTALKNASNTQRKLGNEDLSAVDDLALTPDETTQLKNALVQRDMLSDAGIANRGSGPFQKAFGAVGSSLGGIAGAASPVGHIGGLKVGGLAGGALGRALDNAFQLGQPELVKQASDAVSLLDAAGQPIPNTRAQLDTAISGAQDAITQQRALLAGQAAKAAQDRADAAAKLRGMNLQEAAANQVQGMAYKMAEARANREQGIVGAKALQTPQDIFSTTGGAYGSPAAPTPPMAGFTDPNEAAPTTPSAPVPIYKTAQLRAARGQQPGAIVSDGAPNTYSPDTTGLSQDALAQAARLPDWKYGLGASLENALQASGQARPVNMGAEVNDALSSLQSKGYLPDDIAAGLKSHGGRVVPLIYNLVRNEMLLKNGIDRTNQ